MKTRIPASSLLFFASLVALLVSVASCTPVIESGTESDSATQEPIDEQPSTVQPANPGSVISIATGPNLVGTWKCDVNDYTFIYTFTATAYTVDVIRNNQTTSGVKRGTYVFVNGFKMTQTYPSASETTWSYTYTEENGVERFNYCNYHLVRQ